MEDSKSSNTWVSVYELLKDKIIRGIYGPGEKLNERDIAQLANVSRTPTREALRVLENEGFVTNVSKRGVIVKKYSPEELDTLHKMLIRLEGLAVEMAAPKLTEKDLADLQKMNKRLEGLALKGCYSDYLTLNIEFHLFFARKTGSGELLQSISQLRKRVFRFAYSQVMSEHRTAQYLKDHRDLIDALKGKIKEKPEKIMGRHIDYTREALMTYYKRIGQ